VKRLVGTDVGAYSFAPGTNQVIITGVREGFVLEQLMAITDVTSNVNLFNPWDPTKTATLTQNANGSITITLAYACAALSATDRLQVYLDLPEILYVQTDGPLSVAGVDQTGVAHPVRTDGTGALVISGQQQVGGTAPAGSPPVGNPVEMAGLGVDGLVHMLATEITGMLRASLFAAGPAGLAAVAADAQGQLRTRPAETNGAIESANELLLKILLEMKKTNFLLSQLPGAFSSGSSLLDDLVAFQEDPTTFNIQS
jgi:hypothetical protein